MIDIINIVSTNLGGAYEVANSIDTQIKNDKRFRQKLKINSSPFGKIVSKFERKFLMNSQARKKKLISSFGLWKLFFYKKLYKF